MQTARTLEHKAAAHVGALLASTHTRTHTQKYSVLILDTLNLHCARTCDGRSQPHRRPVLCTATATACQPRVVSLPRQVVEAALRAYHAECLLQQRLALGNPSPERAVANMTCTRKHKKLS
eukprot:COSAG02_NODE_4980_length_4757_cov_3.290253_5_plen_121_part_00